MSNFTKESLISTYDVPPSKIKVIYNGICPEDFVYTKEDILKTRVKLGFKNDIVFLSVGRLNDRRKRLPLLLKAFSILCQSGKTSVKLLIVGSGDQRPLMRIGASLGIEKHIVFTGYLKDLRNIYGASDVFISTSLFEGFGLTLLEAMVAGKPVIAYKTGGIPELVEDGNNGKLLNSQNPMELADAMAFFANNLELTRRIGQMNRKYVTEKFNWKTTAKMTEQAYKNL